MLDTEFLTIVGLGFVLGLRHALDTDHLAAVSTVLAQRPSFRAAGMIGLESHQAALSHSHFIRIRGAGQTSGGKAITNLNPFDGIDAHQRTSQIRIQLAVNGGTQAGGHTFGHNFDHRTH